MPSDLTISDLKKRSRWDVVGLIQRLRNCIDDQSIDIVLSVLEYSNLLAVAASMASRRHPPVVISEHNDLSKHLPSVRFGSLKLCLMRLAYPRADACVAVSHGVSRSLVATTRLPSTNIHVIPNPIDVSKIRLLTAAHTPEMPDWTQGPFVIAVGRLVPQKNYPLLLHAFARIASHCSVSLAILGDGPLRSTLWDLASDLGIQARVHFLGYKENPFVWMHMAAALTLTSDWEGFGNVLVEAMACGTAILSTDCPSGPAEIIRNGENGLLVPCGDEAAVSSALLQLLTNHDLHRKLTRQADIDVRAYDAETITRRYERLLMDTVHPSPQACHSETA
ncbi:MAG: glycosyltransferase [Kiritimatiellae bacterium]|nr:glycosyltransferase [Kiritimatiellia bacterium]